MVEINLETDRAKYKAELNSFIVQLQQLDQQRASLIQAIQERHGILAYLDTLREERQDKTPTKPCEPEQEI